MVINNQNLNGGFDEDSIASQVDALDTANTTIQEPAPAVPQAPVEEAPRPKEVINDAPPVQPQHTQGDLGKLDRMPGKRSQYAAEEAQMERDEKRLGLARVGDNLLKQNMIKEGWMPVDRKLLGECDVFYPADWKFRIRPATVEAIRNWSSIDENNGSVIDDVFNEVIKSCLAIENGTGNPIAWNQLCTWDRFFFLLLIREYTFQHGETQIRFTQECPNCEVDVPFTLNSNSLMYDLPDEEVMKYYDQETRTWVIDPTEYEVEGNVVKLYLPTLDKDAQIKAWMINRYQENRNAKIDPVFIKFASWMTPKISKDAEIAKRQMKQLKIQFEQLDIDQFEFVNDVIRNITVTLATTIKATCPSCGEEVTAPIRFPNGVGSLFNVQNKRHKFGKK